MDDTAPNPQLPQQQPNVQAPSSPGQISPAQPNRVVEPSVQVSPQPETTGQPTVTQQQQPVQPPPVTGGHPESPGRSGLPVREAAPVDETEAVTTASDDQAVVPDAVSDAANIVHEAAPDQLIQESHPAVEVSTQLQEVGVEKGPDAEKSDLPEEHVTTTQAEAKQPDTQTAASGISLTSSPLQIKEVQHKNGIRSSIKWLATFLMRQLKRMQMGDDKAGSPW